MFSFLFLLPLVVVTVVIHRLGARVGQRIRSDSPSLYMSVYFFFSAFFSFLLFSSPILNSFFPFLYPTYFLPLYYFLSCLCLNIVDGCPHLLSSPYLPGYLPLYAFGLCKLSSIKCKGI
jgi:hypothetical protein